MGKHQVTLADRFSETGIHQLMDVYPHRLSRVRRHIQYSCVHPDGVLRAYLDAVTAIDANTQVNIETDRVLLDVGVRMLAGHDGDALCGANCFAEHATHAAWGVIVAVGEPVAAAEARHQRPQLLGELDGCGGANACEAAETVSRMQEEIAEEMGKCDLEAAQDLGDVEFLPESQLAPVDNLDGHTIYDAFPKKTSTTAVTATLATEIGNSPFQPRLMSWS
jgi:hypothetical protein